MTDTFSARPETSEESLEAAGLEVVVAAATTETSIEAAGLEVVVAAATTETVATDDVFIDGNIITAENFDAAASPEGNDLLIVNNGDGSDFLEGGDGFDFVQVNGANGAGDDFSIDPNGERVRDGGEGNDLLIGGDGVDVLRGGAGNDTLLFTEPDASDATPIVQPTEDFYHREYFETTQGDIVPMEDFSLNYEEIKVVEDTSFDAVFDAV